MNKPTVLVPVKGRDHKTRLGGRMSAEDRRELTMMLLAQVMNPLRSANLLDKTYIVSSDREMIATATSGGANGIVEERDRGFNRAVELGMSKLRDSETFLILPSDLPLLTAKDLRGAVSLRGRGVSMVLSPSLMFDGTNLLLFERRKAPKLSYDDNSFWNHLAAAGRSRTPAAVYATAGVMNDVDTPDDVERLLGLKVNMGPVAFLRKKWPPAEDAR